MEDLTIAVVGATGAVGAEFLRIVEQRYAKPPQLRLMASQRSAGKRIAVGGEELVVEEATKDSFEGVDVAFISASSAVSRDLAPHAVAAGAVVIDDGSAFRMEANVPLVVPEVNGADVEWHEGIISIPNCSTTPLVMAAHPLRELAPIRRVIADTYQSVSGAGASLVADLREQSARLINSDHSATASEPGQIAYNLIPQIDRFMDTGYTYEEQKMRQESQKILHDPELQISATCVRVPVYVSHSAAVHLEFDRPGVRGRGPRGAGRHAGADGAGRPGQRRLPHALGRVRGGRRIRGPHPSGHLQPQRLGPVDSLRQPPQRRGPQQPPDSRGTGEARPPEAAPSPGSLSPWERVRVRVFPLRNRFLVTVFHSHPSPLPQGRGRMESLLAPQGCGYVNRAYNGRKDERLHPA